VPRTARPPWRRVYDAVAFTCLFCAVFLLLSYVGSGLTQLILSGVAGVSSERIDVAFDWLRRVGFGFIVLALIYGYTIGQSRLKVTRMQLPLRNFDSLRGLRIAQISDIHIGQNLSSTQLNRFVKSVNELEPDLVCVTGDIADNASSDLAFFLPILAQLRARHAVIAILGNHDHYAGASRLEDALRQHTDFIVLRDEHVTLDVGGRPLHVVGLDDRGIDWARGVRELPYLADVLHSLPANEPVIVLSHRPDIFPQAAACGAGLMLSGHTHGGQIAMPWRRGKALNPARIATRFDRGLFRENGSFLYVNCGLGVTGQRVRLGTPREISLVEVDLDGSRPDCELHG
jgi:predicted MPP superfamily phosphohydrolase